MGAVARAHKRYEFTITRYEFTNPNPSNINDGQVHSNYHLGQLHYHQRTKNYGNKEKMGKLVASVILFYLLNKKCIILCY